MTQTFCSQIPFCGQCMKFLSPLEESIRKQHIYQYSQTLIILTLIIWISQSSRLLL